MEEAWTDFERDSSAKLPSGLYRRRSLQAKINRQLAWPRRLHGWLRRRL